MAIELNQSNFDEIVNQSEKPVVIDFWAEWCGPCRMIAPIIEELAEEYKDKIIVCKLNVDENPELTSKFFIRNIPTVLFIKNGEIVDKQVGAAPKNLFINKIENLLKN